MTNVYIVSSRPFPMVPKGGPTKQNKTNWKVLQYVITSKQTNKHPLLIYKLAWQVSLAQSVNKTFMIELNYEKFILNCKFNF